MKIITSFLILAAYILICSVVFSGVDWASVYLTRFTFRTQMLEWMHAHENQYSMITTVPEAILCTPAIALKPIVGTWWAQLLDSPEQLAAISHSPAPAWDGFYRMAYRGAPYKLVTWSQWFRGWILPSLLWIAFASTAAAYLKNPF